MLTSDGPKVVEFNCRFGDPETQGIMSFLDEDAVELFSSSLLASLSSMKFVGKALRKRGYSKQGLSVDFEKTKPFLFKLPTKTISMRGRNGRKKQLVTNGGVFSMQLLRGNLQEALDSVYACEPSSI